MKNIWASKLPKYYESKNVLRKEKFGGQKRRHIQSSVIIPSSMADYYRIYQYILGILEFDAQNCFDHLLHMLCELCMFHLGLSIQAIHFQTMILASFAFYRLTSYGISSSSCSHTRSFSLHGGGQGKGWVGEL